MLATWLSATQRLLAAAIFAGLIVAGKTSIAPAAEGPFHDLLARIPAEANSLVLLNGEKIRQSPVYTTEIGPAAAAAPGEADRVVPWSQVSRAVLAAQLEFPGADPKWQMAVFQTSAAPTLTEVASRLGGRSETIAGESAVLLPSRSIVFRQPNNVTCSLWPDDRQFAARWVRRARIASASTFYPYLERAVGYVENANSEIVMAIELEGAFNPANLEPAVKKSKVLAPFAADHQRVIDLLGDIEGATLGIKFGRGVNAKLRIDFNRSPDLLTNYAKPLILESLDTLGAKIDDFDSWTPEVKGSTIYLGGNLSFRGLRQLLSLVSPPETIESDSAASTESNSPGPISGAITAKPSPDDPSAVLRATLPNYKSVAGIVKDLRTPDGSVVTRGQYGMWFQSYARKLDNLPILNVDKDLLAYRAETATRLRMVGTQFRMVGVKASTYSANPNFNYDGGFDAWGAYYGSWGLDDRTLAKRYASAAAATTNLQQSEAIENGLAAIRALLTQRYQAEF